MNQLQRDALSLTRSPDFRWMAGMLAEWDPPTGAGGAVVLMQCARVVRLWNGEHRLDLGVFDLDTPLPPARNIRPVLTDPATLGCLAALVRDIAWTPVQVERNLRGGYAVRTFLPARGMQTNGLPRTYDTEADGWVAAFKEVTTL